MKPRTDDVREIDKWREKVEKLVGQIISVGSLVWEPGVVADGAGATSTAITVNGARLGDHVMVYEPYDLQDCVDKGYVQAADIVEIRLQNESGGARTFASGTWRVKVLRW